MSNQVVLDSPLFLISTAQQQVLRTYRQLVTAAYPRDFKYIIKALNEISPLYVLVLQGEDCLAKAAMLSGINAYVALGDKLDTRNFNRMNISITIPVLEKVAGFPAETARSARAAGHTQLIIKARQG